MKELAETIKRQLVLDQMAQDPTSGRGPRTIKEGIAFDTGIHLTRDWIRDQMKMIDPDGFMLRESTAKRRHCVALIALGPHYRWSGDGHDKLKKIGFPIWGIWDVWSGKWLGLWVVPDNQLKVVIVYLYLSLVKELGGMAIYMTLDCSSETTRTYGVSTALREICSPNLAGVPALEFVQSVNNTTIERGWLRLRLQWGDNVVVFWEAGRDIYDPTDPRQYELIQWLWPTIIQKELDKLRDHFNNHVVRTDRNKIIPSGVSPNVAYALPEEYSGEDCLQPVDRQVVHELMEKLGGEQLLYFVTREYAEEAQAVFDTLHINDLSLQNVWHVFRAMLPLMP